MHGNVDEFRERVLDDLERHEDSGLDDDRLQEAHGLLELCAAGEIFIEKRHDAKQLWRDELSEKLRRAQQLAVNAGEGSK